MLDVQIIIAVVAVLILIVFIRIALTLKDIANALVVLSSGKPTQVKVDVALPKESPAVQQEPDETEIAAVIAVARTALANKAA